MARLDAEYSRLDNVLGTDGQPTGDLVSIYDGEIWAFEDRGMNELGEYRVAGSLALVAGEDRAVWTLSGRYGFRTVSTRAASSARPSACPRPTNST